MQIHATNVLIVDDEPVSRQAVAQTLQSAGYRTTVVCSGPEALASLQQGNIQLVVSDWSMPGMTGLDLCRAIRSTVSKRYVYLLLLTSHNRAEDAMYGLQAGADEYVTKPFHPGELILRVNTGRRIIQSESSSMTIFALAKLAESRDHDTGTHLERVQAYCHLLADTMRCHSQFQHEIDDNFVRLIYVRNNTGKPITDVKVALSRVGMKKLADLALDQLRTVSVMAE